MMLPQLVNILMLCLLLSVSMSDALPAVNNNSTLMNIDPNASLGNSEAVTFTKVEGQMIYFGHFGVPTVWKETYAISNHEQYSGYSFSFPEKVRIGTQISLFLYDGEDKKTQEKDYVRLTLRVLQPDDDSTTTTINVFYVFLENTFKVETSSNMEVVGKCSYKSTDTSSKRRNDQLYVIAGGKTLLYTRTDSWKECTGTRPPKK
eukprot:Nk52_evm14s2415 gene=Nk52_evmTU14s2415